MARAFLFFLFFVSVLDALSSQYWYRHIPFSLQKEKYFSAQVMQEATTKDLHIKWTLLVNDLLTMQVNYDKYNHQFNFNSKRKQDTFKLPLFRKKGREMEQPYLLVELKQYDAKKKEASFEIFLRNPSADIRIERAKNADN